MSQATCEVVAPGYRFAHPGYGSAQSPRLRLCHALASSSALAVNFQKVVHSAPPIAAQRPGRHEQADMTVRKPFSSTLFNQNQICRR